MKNYDFFILGVLGGPPKPPKLQNRGFWGAPLHPQNKKIIIFQCVIIFYELAAFLWCFMVLFHKVWSVLWFFGKKKYIFCKNFGVLHSKMHRKRRKRKMTARGGFLICNSNFFWIHFIMTQYILCELVGSIWGSYHKMKHPIKQPLLL